ncbi:MAG: hypothetical protein AAFO29_03615 [Actinomycetota bacterium]
MIAAATGCNGGLPFVGGDDSQYLDAGAALIEGDVAERIDLGPLDAVCRGRSLEPGDAFACTAMSAGQPPIEFVGTISGDGEGVDLVTTNLLLADQVEQIEEFAASLIADDTNRPITADHLECANSSLVVAPGDTLDCLLTEPADGGVFAVAVTVVDLNDLSIAVAVGDELG